MSRSTDLELDVLEATAPKRRGPIGKLFRLITFPVRAVAGIVRLLVGLVGLLVRIVLFPIRLLLGLLKRIVTLAADIVYGLFRLIGGIIGAVVGVIRFFLRLILGILKLPFRIVLPVFRLGAKVGSKSPKAAKIIDAG